MYVHMRNHDKLCSTTTRSVKRIKLRIHIFVQVVQFFSRARCCDDMGFIGGLCKLTAVLVLLVSLLIGSLFSDDTNVLKKIGLFRYLDSFDRHGRGQFFKEMLPAVHEGIPSSFQESEIPDLAGQTVLVTGGNVGLGYWSALHLAAKKANVVIACRSAGK